MFPDNPVLLERLIRNASASPELPQAETILGYLGTKLPQAQSDKLGVDLLLAQYRFAEALAALRRSFNGARDAAQAVQMVQALNGLNRLDLAMRYLRFCLRKWPGSMPVATQFVTVFAKAGHEAEALAALDALVTSPLRDTAPIQQYLSDLHCQAGRPVEALDFYRRALRLGKRNIHCFGLLVRGLASGGHYDLLDALIEEFRSGGTSQLERFYVTQPGQLVTETKLELAGPHAEALRGVSDDDLPGLAELVRAAPQSNITAMRLLHGWTRRGQEARVSDQDTGTEGIPATIFQYWNDRTPPPAITAMTETWRAAEGFRHRLYDRTAAWSELRVSFGSDYARAFQMANNPAEEADFLRLCLLAWHGGVYADADDILIAPLTSVSEASAGLVVYSERDGCTLGNNFLAARAEHPAIVFAMRCAKEALLARANETTWSKTGPGLLTRAVCAYIADCITRGRAPDLEIVPMRRLVHEVAMHNPAPHKQTSGYWNTTTQERPADVMARLLKNRIEAASEQQAGPAA